MMAHIAKAARRDVRRNKMKLLTAEQLGEIQFRNDRDIKSHQRLSEMHKDRQSLLAHIDALQDNMQAFQETIQSAIDEVNS